MKLLKVKVPVRVDLRAYHHLYEIQYTLKLISEEFKVKELGCNGDYICIIYIGSLTDPDNAELVREIKQELKKE